MAYVKYIQGDKNDAGAIPSQTLIETEQQVDGSQRQVIKLGEMTGGRTQNAAGNVLQVQIGPGDIISNLPVFVDFAQHQIHEGESHGAGYYTTSVSTISFGLTVPVYNPTIAAPHLIVHAQIYEGAGMLSLWEDSTFTGGAAVTDYNRNRNSLTAPGMTIKSGVTVTAAGTRLPYTQFVGASQKTSGESRSLDEIVLKSNTIYTVVFEELVPITRAAIHFEWYEDLGV